MRGNRPGLDFPAPQQKQALAEPVAPLLFVSPRLILA